MNTLTAWSVRSAGTSHLLHTNWLLGVGVKAWPGMKDRALFETRADARAAAKTLSAAHPFRLEVVKIRLEVQA